MLKRETKTFKFEVKAVDEDEHNFTFEGYASTFGNVDFGDDIVQQGAFNASLKLNPQVPILWQHRMSEPIGVSVELREDNKGLYVKATLPKADSQVSGKVMPQIKVGSIKEMSIGFFAEETSFDQKTGIRTLEKINLYEISLVTKAMNPQATVNDFKSFKDVEINNLKDIETFLKDGKMSQSEAKTLISKIKEFSNRRDVDELEKQRDAGVKAKILADLQDLTNFIKQK